jgi:hypothetical protein
VRRLSLIAVLALGLAACGGSSQAAKPLRVEFGIAGGNILPRKYTLSVNGHLASELRSAFGSGGLVSRRCSGMLPDVAGEYIRVGGRTVTVVGACEPRFTQLWKTLYAGTHGSSRSSRLRA